MGRMANASDELFDIAADWVARRPRLSGYYSTPFQKDGLRVLSSRSGARSALSRRDLAVLRSADREFSRLSDELGHEPAHEQMAVALGVNVALLAKLMDRAEEIEAQFRSVAVVDPREMFTKPHAQGRQDPRRTVRPGRPDI